MKQLILVRHAKSSWKYNVSDRERPLKKRGITDAHLVSKAFKNEQIAIDFVYSSPANRAQSTCKIFTENLDIPEEKIQILDKLYDFGGQDVMACIKSFDNALHTVMIFGHNHAFTSIAHLYGDRYIDNLPTSGLVLIAFNVDAWEYAKYGQTKLVLFPRDFRP